jgi:hypothetical protein
VASFVVSAGSTATRTLTGLHGDPALTNSFVVTADGSPGDFAAKLISASSARADEIELMGKDQSDLQNGGDHPWSLQNGLESTLLLFNHSKDRQLFNVVISGEGKTWTKAYTLQANETSQIGIREVIQSQTADDDGNRLPKTLESGEVNWFTLDAATGKGRLLVSDRSLGIARSFSCGTYNNLCGGDYGLGIDTFSSGDTVGFGSLSSMFCRTDSALSCTGEQSSGGTAWYSWSPVDTTIAPVSGSSTSRSVSLYGAAPGTTGVNWSESAGYCHRGGQHPANVVPCPTSVSVTSQSLFSLPNSTLPTPPTLTGIGEVAMMSVSGSAGPYTNARITESVSPVGGTCNPQWQTKACQGSSTFTVGNGETMWGTIFLSNTNVFYDNHGLTSSNNVLGGTGSCTITCSQTYYCGGNSIGQFTINFSLDNGTVGSTAVTEVTAGKTQN